MGNGAVDQTLTVTTNGPPSKPTAPVVSRDGENIVVAWTEPASDSTLTAYEVTFI